MLKIYCFLNSCYMTLLTTFFRFCSCGVSAVEICSRGVLLVSLFPTPPLWLHISSLKLVTMRTLWHWSWQMLKIRVQFVVLLIVYISGWHIFFWKGYGILDFVGHMFTVVYGIMEWKSSWVIHKQMSMTVLQ